MVMFSPKGLPMWSVRQAMGPFRVTRACTAKPTKAICMVTGKKVVKTLWESAQRPGVMVLVEVVEVVLLRTVKAQLTMARRPFLISFRAMVSLFMPAGSKG